MTHCAFLLSCFSLNLRSRHSCGIIQLLMSYLTGCLFFFNSYHSPWLLQWPILWAASVLFIASVFFRIRFPPISGGLGAQGATINSQQSEITSAHWFAAWLHQCDLPKRLSSNAPAVSHLPPWWQTRPRPFEVLCLKTGFPHLWLLGFFLSCCETS